MSILPSNISPSLVPAFSSTNPEKVPLPDMAEDSLVQILIRTGTSLEIHEFPGPHSLDSLKDAIILQTLMATNCNRRKTARTLKISLSRVKTYLRGIFEKHPELRERLSNNYTKAWDARSPGVLGEHLVLVLVFSVFYLLKKGLVG